MKKRICALILALFCLIGAAPAAAAASLEWSARSVNAPNAGRKRSSCFA